MKENFFSFDPEMLLTTEQYECLILQNVMSKLYSNIWVSAKSVMKYLVLNNHYNKKLYYLNLNGNRILELSLTKIISNIDIKYSIIMIIIFNIIIFCLQKMIYFLAPVFLTSRKCTNKSFLIDIIISAFAIPLS